MIKRLLLLSSLLCVIAAPVSLSTPAFAQAPIFDPACDEATADSPVCSDEVGEDNISGDDGVLVLVVNILSFVVGALAVIMIIFGGLKYITSNGDANSISSAKNTVLYALIGIGVFAISQAIVIFVLKRL